jgi:conjugative relaxase-like TrwC/TraI family protein
MLTISNVGDNIGEYYATEDYYQSPEEGELIGQGVEAFGFEPGSHNHEQFMSLVGDVVGTTGKDGKYKEPLKAYDLTFSAPKSVSVLYGQAVMEGDTSLSEAIKQAQHDAVKDTFLHMEEAGYFQTKIKFEDGRVEHYRAKDVVMEIVPEHLYNRDIQWDLHSHGLIASRCHAEGDPSGKERALYIKNVYNNQKNIDAIYKQYLAKCVQQLGFSVEFSRGKKQQESFEVVGIDNETRDIWSRRPKIAEHLMETRGKTMEEATASERQHSTLATRQAKHTLSPEQMHEHLESIRAQTDISLDSIRAASQEYQQRQAAEMQARYAEQQAQYQQAQAQQQQYHQQQADQAEFQRRQQAANQAAQQREAADRRHAQERRARETEIARAKAKAQAEAMRPGYRNLSFSAQPSAPEAPSKPEIDYGGFSHSFGSRATPTSMPDWPKTAAPSHRASYQLTAWECSVLTQRAGYEQFADRLPPDWRYLPETRRAELREILDLPRTGHPETTPMVWHTGLENASLPENWLNMTDPERDGWRRDQLSHDPGREAAEAKPQIPTKEEIAEAARQELMEDFYEGDFGGSVDEYIEANLQDRVATLSRLASVQPEATPPMAGSSSPEPSGLNIIDAPSVPPIDPKKEVVRQALQDCEDLRGVWTAQSCYADARKAAIAQGIGLDLDEFKAQFAELRAEKGVVDLPGQDETWLYKRYTTQNVLDADRYIQHVARNENKFDTKLIDPERAKQYTEEFSAKLQAEKGYPLLFDQINAVKHIAEHSDALVIGVQGRAGTGKSTTTGSIVCDLVGRDKVTCLATAAAAAGNLGEAVQVDDVKTIASFTKKYEKGDAATLAKLQDGIILLDEAGMTGSVEMAKVLKIAQENNARVVLIGDTDQLAPVSAGCPFLELQERASEGVGMQTAELRQIVRQKDVAAREAVLHVVDGETKEALDYLIDTNQIEEIKEKSARYKEIIDLKTQGLVDDFTSSRDIASGKEKSDYLCMVSTNTARDKINNGVRQSLQQQGALDKTQDRTFTVTDKDGNEFSKKFAPGDHIIFLQNDNKIGIHNSDLAQIQSIEDKNITAKLASGDVVSFNADSYNRFDYGYALTTYKAQGATQRRAIYDADSKSPLLNKNEFYVGLSRFTEEVHIFTDSKRKMAAKIQRSQEKRSALAEYEKGQARENGHPYVEAVEAAHEKRKSADQDTKEKQRRLTHSYQGDYRRVPREFRNLIDQEFESHRKQFASDLDAAKEKFGSQKDSVTKDMNASIDKWKENQQKIKVDGYRAEAIAKQKGAITKEEREAKKTTGSMPEWQKDWLQRDPDARARAEHAKLVNAARRSHQSLDTRLAAQHAANDKALEKKLTEYTPRRQLADELARREELAKAKSNDPVIAARDRPAHLAAEKKAEAIFAAIREAEKVQKDTVKQIAADQREAKAKAEKEKQDFGPEERKPFIQRYQAANGKFREDVKDAVTKHCDSPEAGQAIHDALDKWQRGQDAIKKQSTQNVKQYIRIRDRKQPTPTKTELSKAKSEFEKENERVKKLYKANKAALDKTFTNIKTFIKEEELRKYYESTGRTAPEATVKPIRGKDADGKETVTFRAPDQSARKTRAEKEIGDLVSEFRSLTESPKHPFMKDLAATRAAWEADRRAINGDKAKELEALKAKDPDARELPDDRQKHYRERHANATGKFKARVEELTAKHGGDKATAEKVMSSLRAWESRQNEIRKQSSALYREKDGKPRKPTQEEKAGIVEKYRNNDGKLDKDFDTIRKELDSIKKEKAKAKKLGKEPIQIEKNQSPEKLKNEKTVENDPAPKAPTRDPKQIVARLDAAIRADEDRFFSEIEAATKDGIKVDIPDRKAQVQGILVGTLKGKDGKNYAVIATGSGNYSAVPATGDIRSMLGKPVLAGRNGIAEQGAPTPGSSEINKFMLCRPLVAKQFGAKLGKMMQRLMDNGRDMELSL